MCCIKNNKIGLQNLSTCHRHFNCGSARPRHKGAQAVCSLSLSYSFINMQPIFSSDLGLKSIITSIVIWSIILLVIVSYKESICSHSIKGIAPLNIAAVPAVHVTSKDTDHEIWTRYSMAVVIYDKPRTHRLLQGLDLYVKWIEKEQRYNSSKQTKRLWI
jgi:hypothetical protein